MPLPPDPHRLLLTLVPEGDGPWLQWVLTIQDTGKVLDTGKLPVDHDRVRRVCDAYHREVDASLIAAGACPRCIGKGRIGPKSFQDPVPRMEVCPACGGGGRSFR